MSRTYRGHVPAGDGRGVTWLRYECADDLAVLCDNGAALAASTRDPDPDPDPNPDPIPIPDPDPDPDPNPNPNPNPDPDPSLPVRAG